MKKRLSLVIVLLLVLIVNGCSLVSQNEVAFVKDTTCKELEESMSAIGDKCILVDVREPIEYLQSHIEGTMLFPVDSIMENVEVLNPNKEYVIICAKGGRSSRVADFLIKQGFSDVTNVDGGMQEWKGEVIVSSIKIVDNTIMINDQLEVGDIWDYEGELFDVGGFSVDIPTLALNGPVIVVFYRGYEHG